MIYFVVIDSICFFFVFYCYSMDKLCVTYEDEFNVSVKVLDKTTWDKLDRFLQRNESNQLYKIERDEGDYLYTGRHLRKSLILSSDFIKIELIESMFPDGLFCNINMIDELLKIEKLLLY